MQIARINVFNYVGFLLGSPLVTTLWGAGVPYRAGLLLPAAQPGLSGPTADACDPTDAQPK